MYATYMALTNHQGTLRIGSCTIVTAISCAEANSILERKCLLQLNRDCLVDGDARELYRAVICRVPRPHNVAVITDQGAVVQSPGPFLLTYIFLPIPPNQTLI